MILSYDHKKPENEILSYTKTGCTLPRSDNYLFFSDNTWAMQCLLDNGFAGKVDLVYTDPPFASGNTFRIGNDRANSISLSYSDNVAYHDAITGVEFIEYLRERLILARELLSDNGSIYLHTDYKIGHYIKIMMDEIFGPDNYRNDISRIKCNPKNFSRKGYGNIKDMILFYTKTADFTWNEPKDKMSGEDIDKLFTLTDSNGRKYTTNPLHAPGETRTGNTGKPWRGILPPKGRHWRYPVEELEELDRKGLIEWSKNNVPRKIIYANDYGEKRVQDIWEYKDSQKPLYPTEKNRAMLNLILRTSSNEGSLVMDCFSGSGSLLFEASALGRKWIGMDSSREAINVTVNRFSDGSGVASDYAIIKMPCTEES